MKTAMQLALARIEMLYIEKDSIHWEMFKNDCIEKEKKQITDACWYGHDIKHEYFNPIHYFDQTYNQNK